MPSSTPPEIHGFSYVRSLGVGGFSDVYLYRQRLPRRQVAIKVLRVDALDRQLRRQFVAEANLMAQLSTHPAIATIYAADVTGDAMPYLVMEYCSGGSLGQAYKAAPLDVAEVLRVGVRVASALEAAHRLGIVHRDVKPANILVTDYGSPVLTDFGISIGAEGIADTTTMISERTATTDNSAHGLSIPWAPPEAFEDDAEGTPRSDIYSLGATLFTLLEGRTPFEVAGARNGPVQLSRRIESGLMTPGTREDVPESLRAVLATSMQPLPENRFPTALAFAEAIQAVQRELGEAPSQIELPVLVEAEDVDQEAVELLRGNQPTPDGTVLPEESTIIVDRSPVAAPAPVAAPVVAPAIVPPVAPPPAAAQVPPVVPPPAVPAAAAGVPSGPMPVQHFAATPPAAYPSAPKRGGGGILIGVLVAAFVLTLGGIVAGVVAIATFAQTTANDDPKPGSSTSSSPSEEGGETPTTPVDSTVPMCDADFIRELADDWKVDEADIVPFTEGKDDKALTSGLPVVCGASTASSPQYADQTVQTIFFEAEDGSADVLLDIYDPNKDDRYGPDDYSSFTAWGTPSSNLYVSIREYSGEETYTLIDDLVGIRYLEVTTYYTG